MVMKRIILQLVNWDWEHFQHPLLYLKGGKYNELLVVLNFMHLGGVKVDDHNRILKQKKIELENRRFMKPSNRNYMNWWITITAVWLNALIVANFTWIFLSWKSTREKNITCREERFRIIKCWSNTRWKTISQWLPLLACFAEKISTIRSSWMTTW